MKKNAETPMTGSIDCRIFADQLDALVRGALPEEGMRHLLLHAEACSGCATQMKIQEHLVHPSLHELEARVPETLVAGMWDAVRVGLREQGNVKGLEEPKPHARDTIREEDSSRRVGGPPLPPPAPPSFSWLVPTLAAATLILLMSTGFFYWESARLQDRATALARQVEDQQHWMAELELNASDPVARTAALAGRNPWARALSRQEEISLRNLRSLLARVPADRIILSQEQMEAVLRNRPPLALPLLREALGRISGTNGVTAQELMAALDGLDVNPDTTVPTADLIALLS